MATLGWSPRSPAGRLAARFSRRRYGAMLDPLAAIAHHRGVLTATARHEMAVARTWTKLEPRLRDLAELAASCQIGCAWCIDLGSWMSRRSLTEAKVRDLTHWRDSSAYDELERLVHGGDDRDAADGHRRARRSSAGTPRRRAAGRADRAGGVGEPPVSLNAALGLRSQGFAANCAVLATAPAAAPARTAPVRGQRREGISAAE